MANRLTKRLIRTAVAMAAALACGGALADPVSIGAFAVATIGDAAATWIVQNAVVLAVTALSFTEGAMARRKARKQAAAARSTYLAGLQDRTVNIVDTEAPWQVVYGAPAPVGCSIPAFLTSGNFDDLNHLVCVFASHPCEAIDEIYIDGIAVGTIGADGWAAGNGGFVERSADQTNTFDVTFDAAGTAILSAIEVVELYTGAVGFSIVNGSTVLTGAPGASAAVACRYRSVRAYVNVQKHLSPGGVDAADAYLMAQCPGQWTADHKLSGFTYAVVTLSLAFSRFQSGRPTITARLRGKNTIYDPRTGVTGYSRNPSLCLADFLRSDAGYRASADQIESPALIAAANQCDYQAYASSNWAYDSFNFGGSPALYVCDGAFSTDQDVETTRQQLEDTMCGNSFESGGVWRIMAGAWSTPVLDLQDSDLLALPELKQGSNSTSARYNGATASYLNATGQGTPADEIPPYRNAAYLAEDGRPKSQDLSLPFVGAWVRAAQNARVRTVVSRGGMALAIQPKQRGWALQPGDRIRYTSSLYQFTAKTFRVSDWTHTSTSPLALEIAEDDPAFYVTADGTGDPAPNTALTDPFGTPEHPQFVQIASGTAQLLYQGGTATARVLVVWQKATNIYVLSGGITQLRWRPVLATEDDWKSADQPGDATSAYLLGLPEGQDVLIGERFVSSVGKPGPWAIALHTVLGKSEPPPQVVGVAVGTDRVIFSELSFADVPDLSGYLVRSVPGTAAVWSLGVPLHRGVVTDSPWLLPTRLYGVQTIMVAAVDDTGHVGLPGSATQDFGQPDVSTAIQQIDVGAAGWPEMIYSDPVPAGRYPYGVGEVRRFARASTASYVTVAGAVAFAAAGQPRIDYTGRLTAASGGGKNLLYRSNEFENAGWSGYFAKPAISLTTAPDGTLTARRLASADGGPGPAYSGLILFRVVPDGQYTASAWLRAAAGTLDVYLGLGDGLGLVVTIDTVWRRYSYTSPAAFTSAWSGGRIFQVWEATPGNAPWEIWHAQVNAGATALDYVASDSDAVGLSLPAVVFENPQLLIEAAAANFWPYSTRLSDQWVGAYQLVSFVEGLAAPDGLATATRLIAAAGVGQHYLDKYQWGVGLQTFSIFAKPAGLAGVSLQVISTATYDQAYANFNLVTGTVIADGGPMLRDFGMQPLAGGWWRLHLTFDNSAGSDSLGPIARLILIDSNNQYVFGGDDYSAIDVWGFNLVAGALSSYIHQPSMTSRAADSAGVNSAADAISYNWDVEGGDVAALADGAADFWTLGADFWVRDGAADFWGGSSYLPMVYTCRFVPAYGGGTVLLEPETEGSRTAVDYRIDGGTRGDFWLGADGAAAADFWGAAGDIWGGVNAWQPWLGQVTSVRGQAIEYRVSIDSGPLQGRITSLRVSLVMPLVDQQFGVQTIASGGTRLDPAAGAPPRNWISITSVDMTPISDGSGAVTGRIKDFSHPKLGAQVELLNSAGVAVTGTATAAQHGYEDTTA